MVDVMYEGYGEKMAREGWEKERVEDNALPPKANIHLLHHLLIIQMGRYIKAFKQRMLN